ncbi:DEAD/DEAH box helicase [Carboxylicivirga sp. RSCT41]|uniref:DEAD/DEAH box helicase n=1 Tax=Carboxylicivirga agarovorans TaxID=3417570 RepID=UPI003D33936B
MKNTHVTMTYLPSTYKGITEADRIQRSKVQYPSLKTSLGWIKDCLYSDKIRRINDEPDEEQQKILKQELLPMLTFYASFVVRKASGIDKSKVPTGILVIDLDKKKESSTWEQFYEEVAALKSLLLNSPFSKYIAFIFNSPRKGWKIGIKTDLRTYDANTYKAYYITLIELFQIILRRNGFKFEYSEVDYRCQDIARGHYISADSDIYINPNVVDCPLTKLDLRESTYKSKKKKKTEPIINIESQELNSEEQLYNRDVNNRLFNYFIINEIMQHLKNRDFKRKFIKEFDLGDWQQYFILMCSLQHALGYNKNSKHAFETILKTAGVYKQNIMEQHWKKVSNPTTNINYFIAAAHKAGYTFTSKDYHGLINRAKATSEIMNNYIPKADLTVDYRITDEAKTIFKFINSNKFIQIIAPTSSGKTDLAVKLLHETLKSPVALSVPYRILADGIRNQYKEHVTNSEDEVFPKDFPVHLLKVMCYTYDSTPKLDDVLSDKIKANSILVIDEIHQVLAALNYRKKSIRALLDFASGFGKVIGLTGTRLPESIEKISPFLRQFKTLHIDNRYEKGHVVNFEYKANIEASIIEKLKPFKGQGKKWAIYMNDKDGNKELAKKLQEQGFTTMVVNADKKNSKEVKLLKKTRLIPDDVDIIIVTSAMRDGFNIENKDVAGIFFYRMPPVRDLVQFSSRFREVKGLQISVVSSMTEFKLNNCYNPELVAVDCRSDANIVIGKMNDILLPSIVDTPRKTEITEKVFYKTMEFATDDEIYVDNNIKHAIAFGAGDRKAHLDEEGIAYCVLENHDKTECSNPIFFVSELLKYRYKIGVVNTGKKLSKEDNVEHMDEAKKITNELVSKCKTDKDFDELLEQIKDEDSVATNVSSLIQHVSKRIAIIGGRSLEIRNEGYKSKTAITKALEFDEDKSIYNVFISKIRTYNNLKAGIKDVHIIQYEKNGLQQQKEYSNKELKALIRKSKDEIGDTTKDLPKQELSKYYQLADGKKRSSIVITDYVQPDVLPDDNTESVIQTKNKAA